MGQGPGKYDPAVRDELDKANWDEVLPRVLKYAASRAKKYYWLGEDVNPEDMVNEVIARAYGVGTNEAYRNWNKEKYPKLEDFLISIISSMTSHQADHSIRFRKEPLFRENGSLRDFESRTSGITETIAPSPKSPEEEVLESERLQALSGELTAIAQEDEEMGMVILCLEDGISRPRDIAEETGYDVKRIYTLLRRIRERLKKFNPAPSRSSLEERREK